MGRERARRLCWIRLVDGGRDRRCGDAGIVPGGIYMLESFFLFGWLFSFKVVRWASLLLSNEMFPGRVTSKISRLSGGIFEL